MSGALVDTPAMASSSIAASLFKAHVPFRAGRAARRPALSSKRSTFSGCPAPQLKARSRPAARAAARAASVVSASAGDKGVVSVAGATGLIGCKLVADLMAQGYKVRVLTRDPAKARAKLPLSGVDFFPRSKWAAAISGAAAVVNLAGEPIGTRWTSDIKSEIKRSRLAATNAIVDAINALPEAERPKVLVNASAVGYYGASESQTFNEASASGRDYLAEVCRDWEAAAGRAQTRVVVLRTGIVLAKEGGALAKMIPVFTIFAGGPLGSGQQWCSWVHRDDVIGMVLSAIENDQWSGSYNATAPNPVRMGELCSALGAVMGRPSFFPVPDFALQALLGEGADVVLRGQRVLPARAQDAGYQFKYSKVDGALRNIMT